MFDEFYVKIPSLMNKLIKVVVQAKSVCSGSDDGDDNIFTQSNLTDILSSQEDLLEELQDEIVLRQIVRYFNIVKETSSLKKKTDAVKKKKNKNNDNEEENNMQNLNPDNTIDNGNDNGGGVGGGVGDEDLSELMSTIADGCFHWAVYHVLCDRFRSPIEQQLSQHHSDEIDAESGLLFWSGNRKRPKPIILDHTSHHQVGGVNRKERRRREREMEEHTPISCFK
jgi:hypothetical protein